MTNEYKPDYVSSPVETILDLLEMYEIDKDCENMLSGVLSGEPIDESVGEYLERLFDIPASYWIKRQKDYINANPCM
jgi:hypothetical protein